VTLATREETESGVLSFRVYKQNEPSTSLDPHSVESDNRIAGVAVLSVYMSSRKE
jgi:hypothetical protein